MFGELNREEFDALCEEPIRKESKLYRDAGLAVMRSGDNYCLLNVDNQGFYMDDCLGSGHAHCDWLSFVLAMGGENFIVDTGSYVYSSDPAERNRFRSTAMHNTIVVDGKSQTDIPEKELWKLPRTGRTSIEKWVAGVEADYIEVTHDGYSRLQLPVVHRRSVSFDKNKASLVINDTIFGEGEHQIESLLHLAPEVEAVVEGSSVKLNKNGKVLTIAFSSAQDIEVSVRTDYISLGYGGKEEARVVCIRCDMNEHFHLLTEIKRAL